MNDDKSLRIYIKGVIFSLIPSVLSFACKSDNFLDGLKAKGIIGTNIEISSVKDILLILSIGLTFCLLGVNYTRANLKQQAALKQRNGLLKLYKDILVQSLAKETGISNLSIDIRIFILKFTILNKLKKAIGLKYKISFKIRNIDYLANAGNTNNLEFEVFPSVEGLVGQCYRDKYMIYDTDLKNTNKKKYNLRSAQLSKTNQLEFSLCCPVFKDNSDDVIGILALDSIQKIEIDDENKKLWRNSIINFSQSLYEHIPQLFKPKGRIL